MIDSGVHVVDRSKWASGPWDGEGDYESWTTRAGLPGLAVRNRFGAWCGYAAVDPRHPWHGKGYWDDGIMNTVTVHGDVTYADACRGSVCHIPAPGQPDDVWWFGFDCAHAGDLQPGLVEHFASFGADMDWVYRDVAYVKLWVERLAEQLAAVEILS